MCICKDCNKRETCELHKDYEKNHCNNGEKPISSCTIR